MSEARPAADLKDALAGRYDIVRELGRGGMATVWLAEDRRHGRQVAVKVLHPEVAQAIGPARFVREIEIAAKLNHPHILPLFDSGEAGGVLFYVMPYVEGESLRQRLQREVRLPVPDAIAIVEHVASALTHAHRQEVVHRDIKPENILLADDQAIVADFGIARAVRVAGAERLTGTGIAIGTPAYMSPEQAFEQETVDGRADVYSLGCVLFEMIAGRPPYASASPRALMARHAADRVPSLRLTQPDVPLFVDRAVGRAMAKEPAQRFATPKELADALRAGTVVAPAGRRRIAVLPPVNVTGDADQQFLVLGLHESLISRIASGDVAVLARTSVLQYRQTDRPVRDICRELAVDALVESSLFRADQAVAIHARLIDGDTEEGLWSGSWDGAMPDILSLYREISGAIAAEIHGTLGSGIRPAAFRPSIDSVAYEKYMRGRVHQQSFNPHDLDRALKYYEAALERQPDYAPAWAGIALIEGSKIVLGMVPALEAAPRYRETAARAVALDPDLAEAHQAQAQVHAWLEYDWPLAEASFRRAIELDPNEPQARIFYSHFLAMLRRTEESDEQIRVALEIDPFNPFTQLLYGVQLGLTGRYERAIEALAAVPPNPLASLGLAFPHMHLGRYAEGLRHYTRYFEMLGDSEMVAALGNGEADPESALIRGAETLVARSAQQFVKPNNIVHLFAWGGDIARAMEWLERSYDMRDHEVAYMGALGPPPQLRADPRFRAFLRRLHLPHDDGAS